MPGLLAIAAVAVACGAVTLREIAEWSRELPADLLSCLGFRHHPLRLRRAPSRSCFTRLFAQLDGDALDAAISRFLTHRAAAQAREHDQDKRIPAKAVDGKSQRGSTRLGQPRRHLLSAVDHDDARTLAQVEVAAKTNETAGFKPLLDPLPLEATVVTFDAMHTVNELLRWLHEDKHAYYIAIVKANQPLQRAAIEDLPWSQVPTGHKTSEQGHGRTESRSVKVTAVDAALGALHFPGATVAIRVHRRRQEASCKQTRETVYAIANLPLSRADAEHVNAYMRNHWSIENRSHHVRDRVFGEDASTISVGSAPRTMASLRNLVIGALRLAGATNIAATSRYNAKNPSRALPALGIST